MSENASSSHVDESRSLKLKSRGVGHLSLHLFIGLSVLSVFAASVGFWTEVVMEWILNGVGLLLYLLLHCGDLLCLLLLFDLLLSRLEDLLLFCDLWGSLCLLCLSYSLWFLDLQRAEKWFMPLQLWHLCPIAGQSLLVWLYLHL